MEHLHNFRFWCQTVLPLVYTDALSYYEALCKVAEELNNVIDSQNGVLDNVESLKQDLAVVQKWIADFDPGLIDKLIGDAIANGVYFGISKEGYFTAYIPKSWKNVRFRTTGLDWIDKCEPEFGHLVLFY